MLSRTVPVHALVVAFFLVCTAGCADDSTNDAAKRWATAVCAALTPWRAEIADLTVKAQEQLQSAKTAAQTKTNIVDLLAGAETASEKARAGVTQAGVPSVDGGDQVATQFTTSLTRARDAYGNAKRTVSGLPTADSKAFYASVGSAFTVLKDEYEQSAVDPAQVSQKDLHKAFSEVPECR